MQGAGEKRTEPYFRYGEGASEPATQHIAKSMAELLVQPANRPMRCESRVEWYQMRQEQVIPTKLLWMDLEFTGFEYGKDVILEVSVEVTDFEFKTLGSYEAHIKNNPKVLSERMKLNTFWQEYQENRDHFIDHNDTGKDIKDVEKELLGFVETHFDGQPAVLAGNSIHSDRAMIKAWWPLLDLKLHYRMLDVSSFKVLMQGKYNVDYKKTNSHRAYDDIQASIAELQYYLEWFQNNNKEIEN
jgi:oligoribonuclease